MNYTPIIGLEIHLELKTKSKMFCSCPNSFEEGNPNVNVCPICLAHPGVIPVANEENDEITLNVQAKVSSISKWLTIGNISAPQISSREAKTIAHLHSGETMVIGGLMNSSDMDNLSGIPGLMNLPILGNLFKFHSKSHNDSEIVITVTPYLVKGDMDVRTILRNN